MMWIAIGLVYAAGFGLTSGLLAGIGQRSPDTYYDCFSGDDWLDFWLTAFWPVFLPAYLCYRIGKRMVA